MESPPLSDCAPTLTFLAFIGPSLFNLQEERNVFHVPPQNKTPRLRRTCFQMFHGERFCLGCRRGSFTHSSTFPSEQAAIHFCGLPYPTTAILAK